MSNALVNVNANSWSCCRLGTFLFLRVLKDGHDRRFNNVRDSPGTFFVYWTIQGTSRT